MLNPDALSPSSPVFSAVELRRLLNGQFGEHNVKEFAALIKLLHNTPEIPVTQEPVGSQAIATVGPARTQLQVVQERLQAQYEATPEHDLPNGAPDRLTLQQVIKSISYHEKKLSVQPQNLDPEVTQGSLNLQQSILVNGPSQILASVLQEETQQEEMQVGEMLQEDALLEEALHEDMPQEEMQRPESPVLDPVAAATSAQRCSAYDAVAQLKPLLADHTIFAATPERRENLLLHLHSLISSELLSAPPCTQSELAAFICQCDGNSSRLDFLQVMTAFLRGSPNSAFVTQIETLLNAQLNENMIFEQVLVPHAPNSISGDAMLAQLAELTPEARELFLLKLSRATLIIYKLITCELAQIRQGAEISPLAEASTGTTPEPPSYTDSESEDKSPTPSTEFISLVDSEAEEQPLSRRLGSAETPTRTTPVPPSPEHDESEEDEPAAQSVGFTQIANLEEQSHRPNEAEAGVEDAPAEGVSGSSTSAPTGSVPKVSIFKRVVYAVFKKRGTGESMNVRKCRKKIDDANKKDGIVAKLRHMSFMAHNFSANAMQEEEDKNTLIEAKKLLVKLNSYVPAVLQENNTELVEGIRLIFATTLNAQLMQEMNKNNNLHNRPATLSMHLVYYNVILTYLEDLPLPWVYDVVYQSVRGFTYSFNDVKSGRTIPLGDFELADVPLNPTIELPHSYYLAALGLPPSATETQARSAYKTLCLKYHPDKNLEDPARAHEMFLRLQIVAASLKL